MISRGRAERILRQANEGDTATLPTGHDVLYLQRITRDKRGRAFRGWWRRPDGVLTTAVPMTTRDAARLLQRVLTQQTATQATYSKEGVEA